MNASLPIPNNEAQAQSVSLANLIRTEIAANGGWLDFARYMHLALYAPGIGYYSGGLKKFGSGGDFVTAPEISPLFARTLARQAAEVVAMTQGDILELGAGTGRLAAGLLLELARLQNLPQRYFILEVSAHLRDEQRRTLEAVLPAELFCKVSWLDTLPDSFRGLVLGNEVLDALPVHVIRASADGAQEMGVALEQNAFVWRARPLVNLRLQEMLQGLDLPAGYTTELCPAAAGLVASLGDMLEEGVILLIDYGFPRREYYHAQRHQGTLICHYRHYAHDDPFLYPGLQDITAHVDFTLVAETAMARGLALKGYCGQAQFLINCGITELLTETSPQDMAAYAPLAAAAQKLLSPAEMGELFKVAAFARRCESPLMGFSRGDRSYTL
jgi:SAM-dependent MidA family methyltransferase